MKLLNFIVQPCFSLITINFQFRCHHVCYKVNARLSSIIRCRYCHQQLITIVDINQRSHAAATRSKWGFHQFLTALQLSINQSQTLIKFRNFHQIKDFSNVSLINLSMSDCQGWLNTLIYLYISIYMHPIYIYMNVSNQPPSALYMHLSCLFEHFIHIA